MLDFYAHKNGGLGVSGRCKECHKEDARISWKKGHNLDPALVKERQKRHYQKVSADAEKAAERRAKKNKWNRSDRYYEGYYQKRFGVSLQDVRNMLSRQNGLCANVGCSKPIALGKEDGTNATGVVDHNHETGKVRSLLCIRCNTLLGHVEKNSQLLPGLLDYLNKHKNK